METSVIINEFKKSWNFIRGMTYEFIDSVPADKWFFTFSEKHSPLCKQFRHMVWISGLYNDALKNRKIDLSKKKTFYDGNLNKSDIVTALKQKDVELESILEDLKSTKLDSFSMEFFGTTIGFTEFCDVIIQHESIHQGLWSAYATLAEFETPKNWKNSWAL
ncbi:MAG: hypothetical protein A2504_17835 [Bdellovibrionales bacterium RIFOXYD12_FULL_39_22]|nr:MAG: hypothetical protein A2385_15175 [Bdellovibrionales bacterium RIFOXYB1_FULL_39_21]OFZ48563.1 MAG: hypothetical protein A2404_17480 [Bdellovibrionales bacterium RIFOXYC1_FULL_39_130]OFZ76664.1 MAG: hypothetical protein A2560_04845 [Bdellovibrionales bacterium RIFOXYD1_FULL_39_84]OFZ95881.1 MAG: hypothetical protein A2504_17835 [Bdellovibrionales bacterium RIFOXYD12_FULL_39_22]HLE12139.1 hypothetical protein [Bacteriovoracaceae bacterium]